MKTQLFLTNHGIIHPIAVICDDKDLDNIITLFSLFQSSPACEKALSVLSNTPNVKIDFTRDNLKFQGQWLADKKEIHIKNNLSLEKTLQTFIFELCNANNPALVSSKLKYSNFLTADAYATYIETAEHQSFKMAVTLYLEILSRNNDALKQPSDIEVKGLKMLFGDETYLAYVKQNGHYDYYVKGYIQAMQKRNSFFVEQQSTSLVADPSSLPTENEIFGMK
ncbi:hypothetical protein [Legionella brunensis]|uniref:Uncharacterized protein n=1 Tax=Legionella brunensis TaxID=29422 RepID=A0A0W0SUI7_9GAMM|nr:hypothetical protein [Legionella brunensis]KTC86877.1 hypothetical protein Lbru_0106 [Legionella brunensis]